ncbi:hypothetical protein FBT96_01215 [Rhodobacter capsulatus]|uniref:Uncharacterized protein n=1 Tax=Rhodobacter capsulatus TaxID=1061 RepID=A0A4U1K1W0_RHOCA|nr:hypothetical protein [Rhodobacter capsulatus]TKD25985.1 hypothetical protein FBT96_01215 [Rhodobacter capsulatus]
MMRRGLRGLMVAALCMVPAAGMAQDLVTVGTVGVWDVLVDPTIGNGCLINAEFEDGSDVRIGFDPEKGNGYLMAMNADWGDIEDDKIYPISFDVDGQVYQGEGKGLHLDGLPGLDIGFDSADFLMDIAQRQTLSLSNAEGEVMSIDLTDSYAALEAAVACQQNQ